MNSRAADDYSLTQLLLTKFPHRHDSLSNSTYSQEMELSPRFQTELSQQEIIFGDEFENNDFLEKMEETDLSEETLHSVFNMLHCNEEGLVKCEDLIDVIKQVIPSFDDKDFWNIYTYVDKKMIGYIGYHQFVELMLRLAYKTCSLPEYMYLSDTSDIQYIQYNRYNIYHSENITNIHDVLFLYNPTYTTFINIKNITSIVSERLAIRFRLDPLIVEDILHDYPRTKIDILPNYIFITLPTFKRIDTINYYTSLSISHFNLLFLNQTTTKYITQWSTLLTIVDDSNCEIYNVVFEELNKKYNQIKQHSGLYLLYYILDYYIDSYNTCVTYINSDLELMDVCIIKEMKEFDYTHLRALSFALKNLYLEIEPIAQIIEQITELLLKEKKTNPEFGVQGENYLYLFRDLADHLNQLLSYIQSRISTATVLDEQYISLREQKVSKLLNLLAILQSLFLPIQFMTGVYGMNFDNFPELHYENAYYIWWGIAIVLFFGMLLYTIYLTKSSGESSFL